MNELGNLKRIREKAGYLQKEIAEYLGVSQGTLSNWESGRKLPNVAVLPKLASKLECRIDDLFIKEQR